MLYGILKNTLIPSEPFPALSMLVPSVSTNMDLPVLDTV